jgi:hypothetical protein
LTTVRATSSLPSDRPRASAAGVVRAAQRPHPGQQARAGLAGAAQKALQQGVHVDVVALLVQQRILKQTGLQRRHCLRQQL